MSIHRTSPLRSVLLYVLLVAGSAVFALPFLYMIGTSFKMDREMSEPGMKLAPGRPVPAAQSPYLDPRFYALPDDPLYARVKPMLEKALAGRPAGEASVLAPGLFQRLKQSTPATVWAGDDAAVAEHLARALTADFVEEVRRNVARELKVGTVRARSFDQQEADLTAGVAPTTFWKLDGTSARLSDLAGEGLLCYDFSGEGRQTIALSRVLDLPFDASRLWRLQVAVTPDDSWHEVSFVVEKNGRRWESSRTQHLGGIQPTVVTLQDRGPDDEAVSTKLKVWLPLDEAGPADASLAANQLRLTVTVSESSGLRAGWLKCKRNYERTFAFVPFWRYVATSVFLVTLNIVGNILSCSLTAYAFSRMQWPGRNLSFGLMMATMMIPPQVTMIPYFLIVKQLGWYNTLSPLWVMSFFGNAFNIFLLRQFMKGIPRDLEDAAKIDGCNFLQIYWHVIIPLVKPTLACIAVFTFMGVWNDFMGPLLFLSDQRLYPISLGLYALNVQEGGNTGMMMAGSVLMTLPVLLLFFFAQRYFIQGITLSGMKG